MDLTDAQATHAYLIQDRDAKYPAPIDEILCNAGTQVVRTGIRIPRMNATMGRWAQTCRHELLNRTPIWNERHLHHALHQFELHYNTYNYRPRQATDQTAPLHAALEPLPHAQITQLKVHRRDRLDGVLHEYQHAA
ncbi:integrase [Streptomyces sp. NPDC058471]|uniref:integrase n=1 Tax=Streptomyces sp. NPDC058471 TaxID=3346516 RepID=UPI003652DF04